MEKERLGFSDKACLKIREKLGALIRVLNSTHFDLLLFAAIIGGSFLMLAESSFAQGLGSKTLVVDGKAFRDATCVVLSYLEGPFGALILVSSGVGAIISAAFGQYRASLGMMIVAIGSYILRSLANSFFGKDNVSGGSCSMDS